MRAGPALASKYAGRRAPWGWRPRLTNELKVLDSALSANFDATAEVIGSYVNPTQGDDKSNRDGRQIVVKSIRIEADLALSTTTQSTTSAVAHLYLVIDRQSNDGTAPAVTDVLTSTTLQGALPNTDNAQRFRILKHWRIPLNSSGMGYTGAAIEYQQVRKHLSYYRKLNLPVNFDSSGNTTSNNLILIGGANSSADDASSIVGTVRVRFIDA